MNYSILVNKDNVLDCNYIPSDLIKINSNYKDNILLNKYAYEKFILFKEEAEKHGYIIDIMSGYRDYDYQDKLYKKLVYEKGYNYAITRIAKPGCSEHQTGLAIDICIYKNNKYYVEDEIEDFIETKWIHNNCYRYGFILRYPFGKENITKYSYEPWHIRFVGDISKNIYNSNLTLEEYLEKHI